VRQRIHALVTKQTAKLAAALRDGAADGSIRSSLLPDQAATALWAMMNGLLTHHIAMAAAEPIEPNALLAAALDILRHGVERS